MKITRRSNWCEIDELGGEALKDGEMLYVTFPDRVSRIVKVKVKKFSTEISDMGTPCLIPHEIAYWDQKVYGVKVQIPLVGLTARRIK